MPDQNAEVNEARTENHKQICTNFNLGRTRASKKAHIHRKENEINSKTKKYRSTQSSILGEGNDSIAKRIIKGCSKRTNLGVLGRSSVK